MQARQPSFQSRRLNLREGLFVHAGCARIRAGQRISMAEDVRAIDLVVEHIEAEGRLRLRLTIQLPLNAPDLFGRLQAHRQSPILATFGSSPEVRALPSTGIARLQRSYDPVRPPPEPPLSQWRRGRDPRPRRVSPDYPHHLFRRAVPTSPADQTGAHVNSFPVHAAFPVMQAGRRPHLHFRDPMRR